MSTLLLLAATAALAGGLWPTADPIAAKTGFVDIHGAYAKGRWGMALLGGGAKVEVGISERVTLGGDLALGGVEGMGGVGAGTFTSRGLLVDRDWRLGVWGMAGVAQRYLPCGATGLALGVGDRTAFDLTVPVFGFVRGFTYSPISDGFAVAMSSEMGLTQRWADHGLRIGLFGWMPVIGYRLEPNKGLRMMADLGYLPGIVALRVGLGHALSPPVPGA
jgi:hypothetical protein